MSEMDNDNFHLGNWCGKSVNQKKNIDAFEKNAMNTEKQQKN